MTDTLTREQIEEFMLSLKSDLQKWESREDKKYCEPVIDGLKRNIALCDLALIGLAVQPRPIGPEASGQEILLWRDDGSVQYIEADENDYDYKKYEGPSWQGVARPFKYIPLSALPKATS